MLNDDNPLWVERYRPRRVADVIMPPVAKRQFQAMVDSGEVPMHLLLAGGPGVGKTSVAQALLDEIGCDYIKLNGSLDGNIDTLRTRVTRFAETVSFAGGRKYVLIDEADHLTHAVQPALRNFVEEYSQNCGFVFTCNWIERIIEPLRGRCSVHEFKVSREDAGAMKKLAFQRLLEILDLEKVKHDKKVVAMVLDRYFPDLRRAINQLQGYASGGSIDSGILARMGDDSIEGLLKAMRDRDFTAARKWVGEHSGEYDSLYRKFYDTAGELLTPETIPTLVLLIGRYQYQAALAADPEINFAAFVAEVMGNVAWRG